MPDHRLCNGLFLFICEDRNIRIRFPGTEIFLDCLDETVGIKVTGHADGHVVWDIHQFLLSLDGGD